MNTHTDAFALLVLIIAEAFTASAYTIRFQNAMIQFTIFDSLTNMNLLEVEMRGLIL